MLHFIQCVQLIGVYTRALQICSSTENYNACKSGTKGLQGGGGRGYSTLGIYGEKLLRSFNQELHHYSL